jgi:hypothetical protein
LEVDAITSKGSCVEEPAASPEEPTASPEEPATPPAETPSASCHSSCLTCYGVESNECLTCPSENCITVRGTCEPCPPIEFVISDPDSILEGASLTWSIKQTNLYDLSKYYLDFSEDQIFFLEPIKVNDLRSHFIVRITFTNLDRFKGLHRRRRLHSHNRL